VLAGRAHEDLLDTYMSERLPHARSTIDLSIALGKLICVADPAEAAERDRPMAAEARDRREPVAAILPRLGPGCFADESPAAGRLFVQDRVRLGGREGRFDDVVGRGFALVSPLGDPAPLLGPELAAFFSSLGGVTVHVPPAANPNGGYAGWFSANGAAVALQRPDFYVFGSAAKLEEAPALVAALRRRLEGWPA